MRRRAGKTRTTGNTLGSMRAQSESALSALQLPATFTFAELHERIERRRGRTINLIPQPLPALAPHGVWIAGESADYVFYDANASQVRQRLIIGHEYGHMIMDDTSTTNDLDHLAAMLMPSVDPSVPSVILARRTYDEPVEQRAEVFATIAVQRAEAWSDIPVSDPVDPDVSARLIATLEGRTA